ncbi:unnamed protein product [Parascedosporium putredinis]|uniref:F-box/LRR-repeat protein 15-like leucin rich repeat domain-containing protein n=1 Tax=Parascedosporium putredinis TaxID=1442378 RepID=A0A9P1M917_9PEZI|nr:unnamed protein product [Parascedosporium putredinis]CAI7991156.1 unnamed protein product [Parascedosporium putredinis]
MAATSNSNSGADATDQTSNSSSTISSPLAADNEESDFFMVNNDSETSLSVPNIQGMNVRDASPDDDVAQPPIHHLPNEILIGIFAKLEKPSEVLQSALSESLNDGSVMPLGICNRVERLTLTNCHQLHDTGVMALVENNTSLHALDITGLSQITEQTILAVARHCKRLQGLNISGCQRVSNESMIELAQSCRYIKRLKLNGCHQLRDDAIQAFADHCPNILEIDLHECLNITNEPITSLFLQGRALRELRLANCELISDSAFLSLPSNRTFENLRILDLTACARITDAAVQKIMEVAPKLRNVVLAKCRNITDASVYAISKLGKNLHYIHLGHCGQITDDAVKHLVQCCNRIRYIDLGCCTNLTDDSVTRLATLPKLKRIGLVKCSNITDESVIALARRQHSRSRNGGLGPDYYVSSLERVHLSYCLNLTLKSIIRLLNACPRLTHLSLTGVAAFLREEFQQYGREAPREFTEHQRQVFCVFSGNCVHKLRDYLNTASEYENLRESTRRHQHPYPSVANHANGVVPWVAAADAEAVEDADGDVMGGFDGTELDINNATAAPPRLLQRRSPRLGICSPSSAKRQVPKAHPSLGYKSGI